MQITARLEAALTTGKSYWFEVKDGTGLPQLKVLDDNRLRREVATNSATERLLQQLGLSSSKSLEQLVQLLSSLRIPFSRETLIGGYQILQELHSLNDRGYQTIAHMIQKQLPLTKETFAAVKTGNEQPSLIGQLRQLSDSLRPFDDGISAKVKDHISLLTQSSVFQTKNPIVQLLSLQSTDSPHVDQLLNHLGLRSGDSRLVVDEQLIKAVLEPINKQIVQKLWPELRIEANQVLKVDQLLSELQIPSGKAGLTQLGHLFQLLNISDRPEDVYTKWLQLPTNSLATGERQILQSVLESTVKLQNEQQTSGTHLKQILTMLGMQYEHDVARFLHGEGMRDSLHTDRLKAMLLMLQQQELPNSIREQVTQILSKLTGQQLLMNEQNATHHQILFTLPLSLGSYQTELTMQWEGKKDEEGQLDPTYCRVLFYLTLEHLQETVIDLQIQNRIISVTVFNEQDKPSGWIELSLPSLKKALGKQDYQLTSFIWKKISGRTETKTQPNFRQNNQYQGLDIRI